MEVASRRALITHGDAVGEGATRMQIERRLAGTRAAAALLRLPHPDWVDRIQPYTTGTRRQVLRHSAGQVDGPKPRAPLIEAWARDALRRDSSVDLVIAGHSHQPARVEVEPGRYYLNAGDWITHDSYLVLRENEPPQLRHWPKAHDKVAARSR